MTSIDKNAFASTFLALFGEYSEQKLAHAVIGTAHLDGDSEVHEIIQCAPFHVNDNFSGFIMWLMARRGYSEPTESRETGNPSERLDSSASRQTMERN